ncbi:hypothetical protein [Laspinema olomoucense]|uniref:hypothetical protein n=1 Tax=Laspinema olomoucense TaxID=3231600 RepID=UPI0021BA8FD1|nr:hypothetical protein [Laspinema sp. D3d]MCT7971260.1 hypothetical protein [Laspinema sp. D3d]
MSTKSCLDCVHCHQWHGIDTLEQPGESGWQCKHPNVFHEILEDPDPDVASDCPYFKAIDYEALAQFEEKMEVLIKKGDEELRDLLLNSD